MKRFFEPSPDWRWHGLGMLQRELTPTTRVHVWHPTLFRVPDEHFRRVHDHRFDVGSLVIHGAIEDRRFKVVAIGDSEPLSAPANTKVWGITHAKVQTGDDVKFLADAHAREEYRTRYCAGAWYSIPRRAFHQSHVDALAVTVVTRENFDGDDARVLGDKAHSAIAGNHFSIRRDDEVIAEILRMANAALKRGDE